MLSIEPEWFDIVGEKDTFLSIAQGDLESRPAGPTG